MKRREARELVFCLVFEKDFMKDVSCKEIYNTALSLFDKEGIEDDPYIFPSFCGVYEHIEEIDSLINEASSNWDKERISRVSRAILRLAIYEIMYIDDIPLKIAVNEAVELAKKFDDEKAFSFINGVLAKVAVITGTKDE